MAEAVLALIGLAVVLEFVWRVIYGQRRRARRMREWIVAGGLVRRGVANDWWRG